MKVLIYDVEWKNHRCKHAFNTNDHSSLKINSCVCVINHHNLKVKEINSCCFSHCFLFMRFLEQNCYCVLWIIFKMVNLFQKFSKIWNNQLSCRFFRKNNTMRVGDYERKLNYDWPKVSTIYPKTMGSLYEDVRFIESNLDVN